MINSFKQCGDKLLNFINDNVTKFVSLKDQVGIHVIQLMKIFNQIDYENQIFEKSYDEKINQLKLFEDKLLVKFEDESKVVIALFS